MDCRQHRDRLAGHIDAGEYLGGLGDTGQALMDDPRVQMLEMQMDMVLFQAPTPRPSRISTVMERLTTSRLARSLADGA